MQLSSFPQLCSFVAILSLLDPEFVDDAKLMAITLAFAIGVIQLGRSSWSAVRTLRDGVVHDAKYHQTAQLMAGKKPIQQLRRLHKLQPTRIVS